MSWRRTMCVAGAALSLAATLEAQSDCTLPTAAPPVCVDGGIADAAAPFNALSAAEVDAVVQAAAASLNVPATIAVVDRGGRPLALFRKSGADPAADDQALGLARTAALFSNHQAPLSSRTVRFISGVHFPPGVANAPVAALYGIEQSNRGCDLNVVWNPNQCLPRARSLAGIVNDTPCNGADSSGCGAGIVTGKVQPDDGPYPQSLDNRAVNAGGIPLYRILSAEPSQGIVTDGRLVGGIGVAGIAGDPQLAEFAAASGAFGAPGIVPVPRYPLPEPQNVFIDGVRLPLLGPDQRLRFDGNGLPIGLERPDGTAPDAAVSGAYVFAPANGGCAPNGYLVGPAGGSKLSQGEVDAIVQRAVATARRTRALIRLPLSSYARMVISVADVDGSILALYRMADATVFSVDVAVSKARNMATFNATGLPGLPAGTFVTSRTIGFGAQPLYPPGIEAPPGPWYSTLYLQNLANPCFDQTGITFFAGSTALVKNGLLAGGLGVSGDGIEQDDYVTFNAAGDLLPPRDRWADRIKLDGARLPMFKFPRRPEGVRECGGGPCS